MALEHADKWGPLGSIFTSLCCLGAAPLVGALTALGLGFLLNDLILLPLLAFFLGISLWAIHEDRPRHGRSAPERLAVIAALLTLGGVLVFSRLVVTLGLLLLVGSSVWNFFLIRKQT